MAVNTQFEEELGKLLRLVAPGTLLRQGLELILQLGTGGLIVVGDTEKVLSAIDGGFQVDYSLTSTALAELAKMDGAIILSRDAKRILYANTQLVTDYLIPSKERGTRHKNAERMAKQTNCPVIAISQSSNIITLYQGEIKYVLKSLPELMRRANQSLQTLERYREVFDNILVELEVLEFQTEVMLFDVVKVIQRGEMIRRIKEEVDRYIVELGEEARLIQMQLKEVVRESLEETQQIIQDYIRDDHNKVISKLKVLTSDELLDLTTVAEVLGYKIKQKNLDVLVFPRGYRVMSKIPRLPKIVVENVVKSLGSLQDIIKATPNDLTKIDEVGEKRADLIKIELEHLRNRALMKKY